MWKQFSLFQLRWEQACKRCTTAPKQSKKHRLYNNGSVLYIMLYCLDIFQFVDIKRIWMNIVNSCKSRDPWLSLPSSHLHSKTLTAPLSLSCHVLGSPLRFFLTEGNIITYIWIYIYTLLGTQTGTVVPIRFPLSELVHSLMIFM